MVSRGVTVWSRAHPRSRGEHPDRYLLAGEHDGSSPLTRGARLPTLVKYDRRGLIPAHAGSTAFSRGRLSRLWAHPRSRGEHAAVIIVAILVMGSSPLTRGALVRGVVPCLPSGLIPAHAGSTSTTATLSAMRSAHPRSRGEHTCVVRARRVAWGSSPLTRGALCSLNTCHLLMGLIPAHAGSTQ